MFKAVYNAVLAGLGTIGFVTIVAGFVAHVPPPAAVLFVYSTVFVIGVAFDASIRAMYNRYNKPKDDK